jgi:phage tail-like protein
MAQTGDRNDPYAAHNFLVVIDGVTTAGFSECSGLSMETDAIEYRNGNEVLHVRKLPGLSKYSNITFKRGFTKDTDLWKWRQKVIEGKTERASGSITLLDEERKAAMRWTFREAWPRKLDGPTFNAKTNDVAIEMLEIVVEQLEVEAA